jgi:hypothetical protein
MALMSIQQAKSHLRLTTNFDYADLQWKIDQASAIIVEYLLARAHRTATIVSSSVASPTVITTLAAHDFVDGETVTISGHVDSTPSLDGAYAISNATSTTFTVPVAITVAGTGGSALIEWTEDTVPLQVRQAAELMLTHIWENRGHDQAVDENLWKAVKRLLDRTRDPSWA